MFSDLLYRLRALFRRKAVDRELEEELQYHLDREAEKYSQVEASSDLAMRRARLALGGTEQVAQQCREARGTKLIEDVVQDLRYAARQLRKSIGFTCAVILTLTLAIGVNSAVFSLLDGFLLRTLPYPHPERIGVLMTHIEATNPRTGQHVSGEDDSQDGATWEMLKSNVNAVTVASWGGSGGVNLQAGAAAGNAVRYVHESRISAHYFDVLGIPLYLGRSFTEEEDHPDGPQAVVLSYALWQSAFHGDSAIIGEVIHLKGEPYTVVGVLPSKAIFPGAPDLFTPLRPAATTGECGGDNCVIVMRLKPGATWEQLTAQISHLPKPSYVERRDKAWFYAVPMQSYMGGYMRPRVEALMLAVGFVLLIACANLAGLSLVRIAQRNLEVATRMALGASRARVLWQLWIESLLLAAVGGAAGLGLAFTLIGAARKLLPDEMVPMGGFGLDSRVLIFTAAATVLTSLLFGAMPALETRRLDLRQTLAAGTRAVAGGSGRIRQWLIGAEVALTVVLLAGAGLLVRTLVHLETLPPGFDAANVMTAKATLNAGHYNDPIAFAGLLDKSLASIKRIPGVEDAAVGLSVPYERGLNYSLTILDGPQEGKGTSSNLTYVTPGYFSTLRIPLLMGRALVPGDTSTSQPVAIVNAEFARHFYNDRNAVGRHFQIEGGRIKYAIVGVVADVQKKPSIYGDAPLATEPVIYLPAAQTPVSVIAAGNLWFQPSWIVRTRGPISGLTEAMQRALAEVDPDLPFSGFYSMRDLLNQRLQVQQVEVALLGVLAGLALMLSSIGIYALVSNLVVQRTREIGIRVALGCTLRRAILGVGSTGAIPVGGGVFAGLALSFFALRALQSEIYGVSAYDRVTLVSVPLLLIAIAAVASLLPALRIAKIDPVETLRAE
jgi:predicted permease